MINGDIFCGDTGASDTIVNHGTINGVVWLYGASDRFNGKGGTSRDIYAYSGNDVIVGGKGALSMHVGTGNSTLTAGPGHDRFVFDSSIGGHVDLIKGFNALVDKIVLSEAHLPGLGPLGKLHAAHFGVNGNAHNASPQIVYI
jgi:Ca2+-binding RTX toxin-like protein